MNWSETSLKGRESIRGGPVSVESVEGWGAVYARSFMVGNLTCLILEAVLISVSPVELSALLAVGVGVVGGLALVGIAHWLHRSRGPRALILIGWAMTGAAFGMGAGGSLFFAIPEAAAVWSWPLALFLPVIGILAGGLVGCRIGLGKVRAGKMDVPDLF